MGRSSPSYSRGRGGGWAGRPEDRNTGREGRRRWGEREGGVAFLRVEVRTRGKLRESTQRVFTPWC